MNASLRFPPILLIACLLGCLAADTPATGAPEASPWRAPVSIWGVEYRVLGADDADWMPVHFYRLPHVPAGLEIRLSVALPPKPEGAVGPMGLALAAMATCEVTWDGVDLGAAGRVGATPAEEKPAPLQQLLHVPDALTSAGEHRVDLRCSMHHRGFEPTAGFWAIYLGPYADLIELGGKSLTFALVSLSGLVLVGLFSLAMWAYDRRRGDADLWLSVFCFAAAALAVAESWRHLVSYTYDWHFPRLQAIAALSLLVAVTLVIYVVRRFPRPSGGRFVAAALVGAAAAVWLFRSWDGKATGPFVVALPLALAWTLGAVRQGRRGAVPAAIGVGLGLAILLVDPSAFIDRHLYASTDLLLLCLLVGHAREREGLRREEERARLEAARLEAELLGRQLEPHFLMNTLTALSEWIEEDPPTAVRMIEALAEEMRTLHAMRRRRTVPVEEEIRLCRAHLAVMSLRRDVRYALRLESVDPAAEIPPAVLHTQLENGITHGPIRAEGGEVIFVLREEQAPGQRVLIFDAPLGDGPSPRAVRGGTGERYITSRIREVYGDAARFEAGAVDGVWRSRLELPRGPA